jgi:esterase/lipase superfamily enzyme
MTARPITLVRENAAAKKATVVVKKMAVAKKAAVHYYAKARYETIEKKINFYKVHIFYGTDRKQTGQKDFEHFYGSQRNKDGYDVGIVDVSIPRTHKAGEVETAPWWHFWNQNDSTQYLVALAITPLDKATIFYRIKTIVDYSDEKDAFVFVHGYNNTFNSAALRTAQLTFDLGFKGAAIMFSWPSQGSTFGYGADDNAVTKSVSHLTDFLTNIIDKSGATKLHVIAHSMGNRALTSALMSLKNNRPGVLFDQIILAAPDVDAELFKEEIAPKIISISKRITLYASSRDRALHASHSIYKDIRLGEGGKNIFIGDGIESIDASDLECDDFFDHAYFVRARPVIDDISKLFYFNAPPEKER